MPIKNTAHVLTTNNQNQDKNMSQDKTNTHRSQDTKKKRYTLIKFKNKINS